MHVDGEINLNKGEKSTEAAETTTTPDDVEPTTTTEDVDATTTTPDDVDATTTTSVMLMQQQLHLEKLIQLQTILCHNL